MSQPPYAAKRYLLLVDVDPGEGATAESLFRLWMKRGNRDYGAIIKDYREVPIHIQPLISACFQFAVSATN